MIFFLRKMLKRVIIFFVSFQTAIYVFGQSGKTKMDFTVAMDSPANQSYQLGFECTGIKKEWIDFK